MEQAQETATKTKPKGQRGFFLVRKGGIVQTEFFNRVAQRLIVFRFNRIQAAENHGFRSLEARQHDRSRTLGSRNRVTDAGFTDLFDTGREKADFPWPERFDRLSVRSENPDLSDFIFLAARHEPNGHPGPQYPVEYPDEHNGSLVGVKPAIKKQRFDRRTGVPLRRRHEPQDTFQHLGNSPALFCAGQNRIAAIQPDDVLKLLPNALGLGAGQIDFVDNRENFKLMIERQIGVGQCLRLNPLGRVNDQNGPFAGR